MPEAREKRERRQGTAAEEATAGRAAEAGGGLMPEPLNYATPEKKEYSGSVVLYGTIGFVIGVVTFSTAAPKVSVDFTPAEILFPLPLLVGISINSFGLIVSAIIAALLQYALYGVVSGLGAKRGQLRATFIAVAAFHVCSVALCMSLVS
jgi:hypothetical protein